MNEYERLINELNLEMAKADVILKRAQAENRALTPSEKAEFDSHSAKFDALEKEIDKLGQKSAGRQTAPQQPGNFTNPGSAGRTSGPQAPAGYSQFRSPGDFFQAVKDSCARGGSMDPRLIMDAPTTTSSEGAGADGGFLVPPAWSQGVNQIILGEKSLIPLCSQMFTPGNVFVSVQDVGAPWATSGGVQAYWQTEGGLLAQSKVTLKDSTIRLNKLTALIPVSEELLEDAVSLDSYLRQKVSDLFVFKANLAIVQGPGTAGEPLGLLNSPALITCDAEAGQDSDTIVFENVIAMWEKLAPGSESTACWLAHKNTVGQILKMSIGLGTGGAPAYMPAGGVSGKPFDTLLGRPLIFSEACNPVGDKGDLILCDLQKYQIVMKSSGLKTDISIHCFFEYDTSCYRFILRLSGSPQWPGTVAGRSGGYYSPYICLAERA